jgi:septin family protein
MENIKTPRKSSKENKFNKMKAPLFKIVLIGESEVGKSTLLNTFMVSQHINPQNNSSTNESLKKSVGVGIVVKNIELKNLTVRLEIVITIITQ